MNEPTSYPRIIIVSAAALACWFLSTFVPSPYTKDTALLPMGPAHVSKQEPLSDLQAPSAAARLAQRNRPRLRVTRGG